MSMINCPECEHEIAETAVNCPHCGHTLRTPKSRGLAAVLALFLGGLGIHKFYLGQLGWGFVYIVFCWTFIPAFLGLIEAILYLFTSEADFQRRYG